MKTIVVKNNFLHIYDSEKHYHNLINIRHIVSVDMAEGKTIEILTTMGSNYSIEWTKYREEVISNHLDNAKYPVEIHTENMNPIETLGVTFNGEYYEEKD